MIRQNIFAKVVGNMLNESLNVSTKNLSYTILCVFVRALMGLHIQR